MRVTGRNVVDGQNGLNWPRRAFLPLLLVTTTVVAGAVLVQNRDGVSLRGRAGSSSSTRAKSSLASVASSPALSHDDPKLDMNALAGNIPVENVLTSSVQVLPAGNVAGPRAATTTALDVTPTTQTRWVKNTDTTTLWSGPNGDATPFTDVPGGSYFRVTGPETSGRLPVYFVGDGLLRQAGNGWVDSSAVATVDAPPPGQDSAVDADARLPLPVWVEAHRATVLWSGPDDKAITLTDLPQWTFLKVAGLERGGRLLVNYAGDFSSRQPGIGWVDQSSVGPTGNPGVWVTNHRATALWSGVDANAIRFTDLPQWSKLRIVDGAPVNADRMQVEFFGDGLARLPGLAWVAKADIGPITPPVPLPSIPIKTAPSAQQVEQRTFGTGAEFIDAVGAAAQISRLATGVPASVTVAQAILESDWGRSRLARQGNNLFGIKALGGASGPAGVVTLATWEHTSDGDVIVQAPFKAYFTLGQSIDDHGNFFVKNGRYAAALAVGNNPRAFAQAIQDAGYATDPSYAAKLIGLMDRYNLYRFDS